MLRGSASLGLIESLEGRRFLSASPVLAPLTTDPGNTSDAALDLGTIDKIKTVQADTIGTGDAVDFYKFTVTGKTTFSATVKGAGKPAKLVKPTLVLTNASGAAATDKKPTGSKQTLGPGTYYVAVNGLETGTATYKLTVSTKVYKGKKAATFTSDGGSGDDGNNNGGGTGTTGGTYTGQLDNISANPSGNPADSFQFHATQSGTFELPASFASDIFWNAAPLNDATSSGPGGGGIGPGDGTLSVQIEAGNDYVFNLVGGQTTTSYSITFDNSFTNVHRIAGS